MKLHVNNGEREDQELLYWSRETSCAHVCVSLCVNVLRTHLNITKVNGLIVEMGTLSQPGEVTSGECQP